MSHNANEQRRFRTDPHGVGLSARMAVESAPEYVSVPRFAQFPLGRGLYNGIPALVLWFRSVFLGSGSGMPGRGASRAWSLLTLLLVYGVLAILPMLAAGGYLLFRLAQAERAQLEERVHQIAEAVAGDVDRELQRRLTVLQTLATSPRIAQRDFLGFHAQAKAALAAEDLGILLHDAVTRQQLVNTFVDYGAPLPTTGDPETFDRVLAAKQAEVSDVFVSLVTKAPAVDIALPLTRNGRVRYLLKLALSPEHFRQILAGQRLDPQWTLTIVDRRGTIIARSRDHQQFAGKALPPTQVVELGTPQKTFPSTNLEGQPVIAAIAAVPSASWQVRVSAPFDVAQAPLNRSTVLLTSAALFAGLLTMLLGIFFASNISRPLRSIAGAAQTLGREHDLLLPRASYKEANLVSDALQTAAAELCKLRDRERLVVGESSHRVKNILAVVQSLVQQTLRDGRPIEGARTTLLHRLAALGRAQDALTSADHDAAPLGQIVSSELAPYVGRVSIEGPAVMIAGTFAQTFALLVHELATNAAKYGSLSNAAGRVSVHWSVEGEGDVAELRFRWQERDGPVIPPPARKGFGSALLETALPAGPRGGPRLSFDLQGLTYEADIPMVAITSAS
jgi:two-component sensor histidine kinase